MSGPPRRKAPKSLPRLPLSAFAPINNPSDAFPLPPSPSKVHPTRVIDANVIIKDGDLDLVQWSKEATSILEDRIAGVVLNLNGIEHDKIKDRQAAALPAIPFLPNPLPISLSTIFYQSSPEAPNALRRALEVGRPVDIDLYNASADGVLEGVQDLLAKATTDLPKVPPIIISNYLPPPHDLALPIVRLMNHPTYQAFQTHIAALSLIPNLYIKYIPPAWNAPTPPTPLPDSTAETPNERQERNEWKGRIKMYLGLVIEAFGFERIIFGTSPSAGTQHPSHVGDWYEIAREALAELGIEQGPVDDVFYGNAKRVYGA
ncbi:hypothetical protein AMATHDRAFT_47531 [Amanita thiersii Skay4041]|uniref:Amidohydrolase-related domain-containing protein n=1 Tax=Amanita thiersii Skay4041 TaxID=703135 RepID=A0A2A9NNM6_9AGAR|nr:hypothetical protein AMATHDRAFT_47531 [Amanita thiersii Skay4041]